MSTSKENISDISTPVPDSETHDPGANNEQSSKASQNTQKQNEDTQISPQTSSRDNEGSSKDENAHLLLKEDSNKKGKDNSPVNRSITATINKVTPLADNSKKKQGKGNYHYSYQNKISLPFRNLMYSSKFIVNLHECIYDTYLY